MEALKGQLKLAREWLRSKHMQGLDFKTWTMNRKECTIKSSVWVGHLSTNLSCGAGIRTNNLHNFKYVGRGGGRWISELIDALWPISSKRACRDFPSLARVCKLSARTNTRKTVSSFYPTFESFIKRMENEICHGSLIWKDKMVMFQKMAWFGKWWVFKILELLTLLGCFALLRRENEAELHQKEELFHPR